MACYADTFTLLQGKVVSLASNPQPEGPHSTEDWHTEAVTTLWLWLTAAPDRGNLGSQDFNNDILRS
jgi:hypothetical protein